MKNLSAAHPASKNIIALFRVDIRTLALFRVFLTVIVLIDLGVRIGDLETMYADQGVIPVHLVKNHFAGTWRWSLFWLDGSIYVQGALFALTAILAVSLLVGFFTRIATVGTWIMLTSIYNRVPFAVSGADTLLVILFFWAMFLPLGRCWSVDAWRRGTSPAQETTFLSGGTVAILIQVFLLYFCTGCYKAIYHADPGMLLQNTLEWADYNRPMGNWLLNFPNVLGFFSWATICFEVIAPWLLFSPWKTSKFRLWTLFCLVAMHVGIELTLSVALFSYVAAAGFCLFLPSEFWDARWWKTVQTLFDSRIKKNRQHMNEKKVNPGISALCSCLCIGLIFYVMLLSLLGFFQRSKIITKPAFMNRLNELTMLNQRWSMFASLQHRQTRLIASARLNNGHEIDLLRIENHLNRPPAPVQHPNHRWVKYFQALSRKSTPQVFKDRYAHWLFNNWNATHSEIEQIQELSLRRLRQMLPGEKNLSHIGIENIAVVRNEGTLPEQTIPWNQPWRNSDHTPP